MIQREQLLSRAHTAAYLDVVMSPKDQGQVRRITDLVMQVLKEEERWEIGFRNIVTALLGARTEFDIQEVVKQVQAIIRSQQGIHASRDHWKQRSKRLLKECRKYKQGRLSVTNVLAQLVDGVQQFLADRRFTDQTYSFSEKEVKTLISDLRAAERALPRSRSYTEDLHARLRNPSYASEYLHEASKDDLETFRHALKNVLAANDDDEACPACGSTKHILCTSAAKS